MSPTVTLKMKAIIKRAEEEGFYTTRVHCIASLSVSPSLYFLLSSFLAWSLSHRVLYYTIHYFRTSLDYKSTWFDMPSKCHSVNVTFCFKAKTFSCSHEWSSNWRTTVCNNVRELYYSSPPLIRPPYLSRNCGHIREVAMVRGIIKCIHSSIGKNLWPH